MLCFIYKSLKKYDTYLYITSKDQFDAVPEALMKMIGQYEFVMELDLSKRDKLGREDINSVKENLEKQGYHLQMAEETNVEITKFN